MKRWETITFIQNYRKKNDGWVEHRWRLEPVMMRLQDDRAVFKPVGLTTRPHTDLYLSGDFILMCLGDTVKTKENQFLSFFQENQTLLEKNPVPLIA